MKDPADPPSAAPVVERIAPPQDHALCYAGFMAFIRGVDIPETVEQARLVLLDRALKAEAEVTGLTTRLAALEQQQEEARKLLAAIDEEASDTQKPLVKFYADPVEFYREMTARIVVNRDALKHHVRTLEAQQSTAQARLAAMEQQLEQERVIIKKLLTEIGETFGPYMLAHPEITNMTDVIRLCRERAEVAEARVAALSQQNVTLAEQSGPYFVRDMARAVGLPDDSEINVVGKAIQARVAALIALRPYLRHLPACHHASDDTGELTNAYRILGPCDCGLADTLAALDAGLGGRAATPAGGRV